MVLKMIEHSAVIKKADRYAYITDRLNWVDIDNATLFTSSYKAGVALQALREQGFEVRKMTIAQVKVTRTVEETGL